MFQLDPLRDARWSELLLRHPSASVFHLPEWLEALQRTYGYEPIVFTTSPPQQELGGGLAFCRVNSWLTGRRLVSLPFSDHCEPLASDLEEFDRIWASVQRQASRKRYAYVELRPLRWTAATQSGLAPSQHFCFHKLDLRPSAANLFNNLHKDCIQRKVDRAERERLVYEEGRSFELLQKFYRLQILTRRRQRLPAQPFSWFRNLALCMGRRLKVHVVSKNNAPIASILTLQFRRTLTYKYGCSNRLFSNLGGMQLLFWKAIQSAKSEGLLEFDLGRSDPGNEGLITFKDRLGARRAIITYWRYPASSVPQHDNYALHMAKRIASRLPESWLTAAGMLLYRHVA